MAWTDAANYLAEHRQGHDLVLNLDVDGERPCFPMYLRQATDASIPIVDLTSPGSSIPAQISAAGSNGAHPWWVIPTSKTGAAGAKAELSGAYEVIGFEAVAAVPRILGNHPAEVVLVKPRAGELVDGQAVAQDTATLLDAFAGADPASYSLQYEDGIAHEASGQLAAAATQYQAAVDRNGSPWAMDDLGRMLQAMGDNAAAEKWFRSSVAADGDPWHYQRLANLYASEQKIPQSLNVFDAGLLRASAQPGSQADGVRAALLLGKAQALEAQGNVTLAKSVYLSALSFPGTTADVHRGLAHLAWQSGNGSQGLAEIQVAIQSDPKSVWLYLDLGDYYRDQGQLEAAFAAYTKAQENAPTEMWPALRLGDYYSTKGDQKSALTRYSEARRLAPNEFWPVKKEADAYRLLQDWANALSSYTVARRLNPSDPDLYDGLGLTYRALGQTTEALQAFEKGVQLKPDYFWLQFHLGEAYLNGGSPVEAFRAFQKAQQLDPSNPDAAQRLADLRSELGINSAT